MDRAEHIREQGLNWMMTQMITYWLRSHLFSKSIAVGVNACVVCALREGAHFILAVGNLHKRITSSDACHAIVLWRLPCGRTFCLS